MKVFVAISSFAVLATAVLVLVDVSPSNAQGSGCPAINTSAANCDGEGGPVVALQMIFCIIRCRACYGRDRQLQTIPGCLVKWKCQCLEQENYEGTTDLEEGTTGTTTDDEGTTGTTTNDDGTTDTTTDDEGTTEDMIVVSRQN